MYYAAPSPTEYPYFMAQPYAYDEKMFASSELPSTQNFMWTPWPMQTQSFVDTTSVHPPPQQPQPHRCAKTTEAVGVDESIKANRSEKGTTTHVGAECGGRSENDQTESEFADLRASFLKQHDLPPDLQLPASFFDICEDARSLLVRQYQTVRTACFDLDVLDFTSLILKPKTNTDFGCRVHQDDVEETFGRTRTLKLDFDSLPSRLREAMAPHMKILEQDDQVDALTNEPMYAYVRRAAGKPRKTPTFQALMYVNNENRSVNVGFFSSTRVAAVAIVAAKLDDSLLPTSNHQLTRKLVHSWLMNVCENEDFADEWMERVRLRSRLICLPAKGRRRVDKVVVTKRKYAEQASVESTSPCSRPDLISFDDECHSADHSTISADRDDCCTRASMCAHTTPPIAPSASLAPSSPTLLPLATSFFSPTSATRSTAHNDAEREEQGANSVANAAGDTELLGPLSSACLPSFVCAAEGSADAFEEDPDLLGPLSACPPSLVCTTEEGVLNICSLAYTNNLCGDVVGKRDSPASIDTNLSSWNKRFVVPSSVETQPEFKKPRLPPLHSRPTNECANECANLDLLLSAINEQGHNVRS